MFKLINILTVVATLSAGYLFSQCPQASKVISVDSKNGWGENSQSKSGQLRPGDTYEMRFILQSGIKYRIQALAGVEDFSADNVDFQVIGKEVNKVEENGRVSYKSSEVILYDSRTATAEEEAIFLSDRMQRLTIRVEVKGNDGAGLVQCAVVLVEAKKTQKLGLR